MQQPVVTHDAVVAIELRIPLWLAGLNRAEEDTASLSQRVEGKALVLEAIYIASANRCTARFDQLI